MSCRSYDKPYGADEALKARIEDAADLSAVRKAPCFVGFLDERQADLSSKIARNLGVQGFMLWGGYEDAQRRMFAAFPKELLPDSERFPVISIYLSFRKEDSLSHRDFLGALMGLGIKREALGDILVGEGRCVLFCKEEIANFVETQLTKVGRTGVKLVPAGSFPLPEGQRVEELSFTVASNRLDCAVACFVRSSREKSRQLFSQGLVTHNYEVEKSLSAVLQEGDKVSIQGYGKFIIDQIGSETKKGRLKLAARKYK